MIWRRLPLIATIIVLGILISIYLIVSAPRVYESTAVIQVDTPATIVPGSDAALPATRRVQLIEQVLTARANMLEVIDRLELFKDLPELSETEKIGALRSSILIESVAASGNPGAPASLAAIVITAQAETPALAAAIANDFANSVVNRDRENRERRIQEAQSFLTTEEQRLTRELSRHDREIAEFSSRHKDALPEAQESLRSELAQLDESGATLDRSIMALQRDQLSLVAGGTDRQGSLVQQIRSAEVDLAQTRRALPVGHPEIARLEDNLRRLKAGGEGSADVMSRQATLLETQLQELRRQQLSIATRRNQIEKAQADSPQVARDLESMMREQVRLQDQYGEISRQLALIETQSLLLDNDQSERFIILERAVPPEYAAMSNRKKRAMMGAIGSFGLAFAAAFLLEMMNPVLRRADQFARVTGARPVVSLRYRRSRREILGRRIGMAYVILILIMGALGALAIMGKIPGLTAPEVAAAPEDGLG